MDTGIKTSSVAASSGDDSIALLKFSVAVDEQTFSRDSWRES